MSEKPSYSSFYDLYDVKTIMDLVKKYLSSSLEEQSVTISISSDSSLEQFVFDMTSIIAQRNELLAGVELILLNSLSEKSKTQFHEKRNLIFRDDFPRWSDLDEVGYLERLIIHSIFDLEAGNTPLWDDSRDIYEVQFLIQNKVKQSLKTRILNHIKKFPNDGIENLQWLDDLSEIVTSMNSFINY